MTNKVAVVTCADEGIGLAIVKELCRRFVSTVYLTAKDEARGNNAVEDLRKTCYNATFFQLDVCNKESVKALAEHLKEKHNGLDILINNVELQPEDRDKTTYHDSKQVIETNYRSILLIQEFIFPILKDNARVVNLTGDCANIKDLKNQHWFDKLTNRNAKVEDVNAFIEWFLDSVKNESLKSEDFVQTNLLAYRISKIAVYALTRIQQNEIGRGISINCLNPGFVKTDRTRSRLLTIEEASRTPVYVVLDAPPLLKGRFIWFEKAKSDEPISSPTNDKELFDLFQKIVLAKENE